MTRERGFGFLKDPESGREFFFHRSVLAELDFEILEPGDPVQFRPEDSAKGPRAGFVTVPA